MTLKEYISPWWRKWGIKLFLWVLMVIADNLYLTAALGWPYRPLYGNHFPGQEWIVCRTETKLASCTSPSLCYFPSPCYPPPLLLITSLFERQGLYKVKSFVIKATRSQKHGGNPVSGWTMLCPWAHYFCLCDVRPKGKCLENYASSKLIREKLLEILKGCKGCIVYKWLSPNHFWVFPGGQGDIGCWSWGEMGTYILLPFMVLYLDIVVSRGVLVCSSNHTLVPR